VSKFGSFEYHAGNLIFFIGVVLLLNCFILIAFSLSVSSRAVHIVLIIYIIGAIFGLICIIAGLYIIKMDKEKSEKGVVIGNEEPHEIKIITKGKRVIMLVDEIPKLEFEAEYFDKKSISTIIGNLEKHNVRIEVKASAWSGEIDKFVYVDNVLVQKDERPIW
jgi:hypothetical protein